ncbi:MAG TPA: hypothetical protein VN285_08795 [Candidatus Deferrimicrobium sp.]|nr:hypothetical protein [Candidatus Deferrimicrobium sp.]
MRPFRACVAFSLPALLTMSLSATAKDESTAKSATVSSVSPQQKAQVSPATGEQIKWQVISSGGSRGTSTNFILSGTVGQTAVGSGSSTNFQLKHGFWQNFASGCCQNRGNVDGVIGPAGPVDVSDLTFLVAFLFSGGAAPPCIDQGNVGGIVGPGGPIDVSDLTYLVAFLFSGGAAPPPC